jgi:hypothetical protein
LSDNASRRVRLESDAKFRGGGGGWASNSVMDRHRFDVESDPDQTFYFDADLDPAPTLSLTHQNFVLLFTAMPVYIVPIFLITVIGVGS